MAVQEIKKLDNANKQMGDVCKTVAYAHYQCDKQCVQIDTCTCMYAVQQVTLVSDKFGELALSGYWWK